MTLITNREYVDIYLKLKDKFKAVTKYEYLFEFKYIKANDVVTDEKINTLKNALNKKVASLGKNRFYMVKIKGTFSNMNIRSEYSQKKHISLLQKYWKLTRHFLIIII